MIIFDLDGTLADCEHRRHLVDPMKNKDLYFVKPGNSSNDQPHGWYYKDVLLMSHPPQPKRFIPDWPAYYEACDKDKVVRPLMNIFIDATSRPDSYINGVIWTGRCESVRLKTLEWLKKLNFYPSQSQLKMRPIGDSSPDHELFEGWLDDYMHLPNMDVDNLPNANSIEMVFSANPQVISMFRRRGIFVFDVNQKRNNYALYVLV